MQRELARLEQSGLVTVRRIGNQKHYQANPDSPIFEELCSIAFKRIGMAEPLRKALAPLATQIHAAFVYGSVAKRQDTAASDIDLMVVSDSLTYAPSLIPTLLPKVGNPLSSKLDVELTLPEGEGLYLPSPTGRGIEGEGNNDEFSIVTI